MTDHSVVESGRLNGDPLSCRVTFVTGRNANYGLCGPGGELIRRGRPLAFNVAYFEAMSEWFGLMKLGTNGHSVFRILA
jgi:hypothetical protein